MWSGIGRIYVRLSRGGAIYKSEAWIKYKCGWGETQRFREIPRSVLVSENDSVELRCAVEHQKGKAQWTKDGFALGFERDVPGYPRYQYSGDSSRGEHHLVISGVTLQDDGEYQCQVGPTNEAPPIWAGANVTVIVAPSSITIIGWGDGAVVEVVSGSSLALECLVSDARPSPSLTWYRDGIELDFSKQRDETEKGTRPRLMSIRSRLHVKAVPADDGQQFSCRGNHPALEKVPSALVASITLSVLHAPSPPKITGFDENDVAVSGQKISLTCTSQGGNPKPWVFWYRSNVLIDDRTTTNGKNVINVLELQVTAAEDKATFECRVTSDMLETPLTTSQQISVYYPPSSVIITGPNSVAIGDELSLQCQTTPSNPASNIRWMIQGKEVKAEASESKKESSGGWLTTSLMSGFEITPLEAGDGSQIEAVCEALNPRVVDRVSGKRIIALVKIAGPPILDGLSGEIVAGAQMSFSCLSKGGNPAPTITLHKEEEPLSLEVRKVLNGTRVVSEMKMTPEDNGKEITCQVNHPASEEPQLITKRLNVLFPPSKVVGRAAPSAVEEGNHVTLSCESSSSNPPANITWYSEGSILQGASHQLPDGEHHGKVTRSELVIRTSAEDDGRIFNCEASNGLLPVANTNITISVSHAPVWVIRPPDQVDVYESEDLIVSATAAANPGPLRYWWRRSDDTLPATGGELRIAQVRRENTGNYSVSAYSPRGAVNATFFINVQYPPEKVMASKKVVVGESSTATAHCSAEGNPQPKVSWYRKNRQEPLATGIQVVKLLFENVSRNETGIYMCSAANGVGAPVITETKVIVTHGAVIVREAAGASGSWAIEGGKGLLVCHARAAPPPTFYWSNHDGETFTNSEKYKLQQSQLVDGLTLWVSAMEILHVTSHDYDDYRCTANNALGADTTLMTLKPPDKPLPPSSLQLINKTISSMTLAWMPSELEGGPIHSYMVRYREETSSDYKEIRTLPQETSAIVYQLSPGKTYVVTVYAINDKGSSSFVEPPLLVTLPEFPGEALSGQSTISGPAHPGDKGVIIGGWRVPRLVVLITTLTGATLLILNIAIISCFVRRRNNTRSVSASSSKTTTLGGRTSNSDNNESCDAAQVENSGVSQLQMEKIHGDFSTSSAGMPLTNLQIKPPANGHLPRKNSITVSSLSVQKPVENATASSPRENSYSVDLLQGSVSPEGRRAAAINPELCSLASGSNECQYKHVSICSNTQDDIKPCASEDQVSLASCQSEHSRSYSYGQIRPMQRHCTPGNRGVQETTNRTCVTTLHPKHVTCQQKHKADGLNTYNSHEVENANQYAPLDAASLCELGPNYYESRCCKGQNSKACRCPSAGTGAVLGYATLGSRNRKLKSPQFATLQRNRPSDMRLQPCSFDTPVPTRCPTGCHCQAKIIYPKVSTYSYQPCSLPACIPPSTACTSPDPHGNKAFVETYSFQHSSSQTDVSVMPRDGSRKTEPGSSLETMRVENNIANQTNGREWASTLERKKNSSVPLFSLTENENCNIRVKTHTTSPKQIPYSPTMKEASTNSILAKANLGPDLARLSPRYLQPSLDEKQRNISLEKDFIPSKEETVYTPSIATTSVRRQKFPHDFVRQQNGSTKDLSTSFITQKANASNNIAIHNDENNFKR